jgi:DNA-binding beta-propeller fold protein YncE
VAPDYSFALVTNGQKLDANNKLQLEDIVSVIGLDDPTHPKVLQTAHAAAGAMGVSMNKKMTLALVASSGDDSVAIFSISGRQLTAVGKIQLEAKSEPRDALIAPDGRTAYVVRWGDGKITKLAIDGTKVTRVADIAVGTNPDGAIITPDGRYLFNTNFGGTPMTTPKMGAVTTIDLKSGKVIGATEVGNGPEHVALSPDGKYLVAVLGNGSASLKSAANFATVLGKLRVFKVAGGKLSPVAQADTGHNCQGAAFSDDGHTILMQCAVEKDIEVFHFDGSSLTRDQAATLTFDSRPGAIATAKSR